MNIQDTSYGHFITENKNRILFFVLLFVLSSIKMFGQTVTTPAPLEIKEEVVIITIQEKNDLASLESQLDFVGWFMGSKQSHNDESQSAGTSSTASTKKQILTSGITPNRVLYRTFMKRVSSKDNAIV